MLLNIEQMIEINLTLSYCMLEVGEYLKKMTKTGPCVII